MTRNPPVFRIPHLLLLALLGIATFPVPAVSADNSEGERESRRLENEARRVEEQGRRDIEDRARIQADALRGQEDAIRRTEAAQARIDANSQQLFQQQNEQLRNYSYPYPVIPSTPVTRIPPVVEVAPGTPAPPALSALAPQAPKLPNRNLNDAVNGMTFAPLSERLKSYFGAQSGVLVVSTGGRAPFGLEDGDVIISVDGRVPADGPHAARILQSYQPGERVKLRVQRDRRVFDLNATAPGQVNNQPR